MSSQNGSKKVKTDWSVARVAAAERLATAVVVGFVVCEEARVPLSQLQQIALIEAALLEFDGFEAQLESLANVDELLRGLGLDQPSR